MKKRTVVNGPVGKAPIGLTGNNQGFDIDIAQLNPLGLTHGVRGPVRQRQDATQPT